MLISITVIFPFICFSTNLPTTDIYTLSLHDALPIWKDILDVVTGGAGDGAAEQVDEQHQEDHRRHHSVRQESRVASGLDRKSTRLNSSHVAISYAVFCLKKKILNIMYQS